MTKQNWSHDTVTVVEIVQHLKDKHFDGFNSRVALTEDEFIMEHFPNLVRDVESIDAGNLLSEGGRKRVYAVRSLLHRALKYCEEHSIPLIRAADQNENGEFEWRICKPTQAQLDLLKHTRYFTSAEGYFNKVVLQQAMLDDVNVDELLEELKNMITQKQSERAQNREAQKILEVQDEQKKEKEKSANHREGAAAIKDAFEKLAEEDPRWGKKKGRQSIDEKWEAEDKKRQSVPLMSSQIKDVPFKTYKQKEKSPYNKVNWSKRISKSLKKTLKAKREKKDKR